SQSTVFRSIEQWKEALITLPDARFFNLVRSILGTIQSPFNKQRLLDKLTVFLSNNDVQETIAAYIDDDDHKIIAAVAALNEPARRDLGVFFSGEYAYTELDSLIANLEDRLIVYAIKEDGRLSLNPLLKKILLPFTADNSILFPYIRSDLTQPAQTQFVYDDVFLSSFLIFLSSEKHILKRDGLIRGKLPKKARTIFPYADVEVFVKSLRCIGLLPDGSFDPVGQKLQDFARLTEEERFLYCAAGVYISLNYDLTETFLPQKKIIQHIAASAALLYNALDEDNIYPASTLQRLIQMNQAATGGIVLGVNEPVKAAVLLEAMEKTALLLKTEYGYRKRIINSGGSFCRCIGGIENIPVIAFNSVFSFVLLPGITFSEAVSLAAFCEIVKAKPPVQFEITRKSAVRGFNSGMSGKTMVEILKKLSLSGALSDLETTLGGWEKRHSEIIIIEGVSLVLSEEQRYIAQAEQIAPHIVLNPSPGVYMLDFAGRDEAAMMLRKAGVDIVFEPHIKSAASFSKKAPPFFAAFSPRADTLIEKPAERPPSAYSYKHKSAEKYKNHFRSVLDELKISQMERDELTSRIERKLIVSPCQLSGAYIRYERREARGLDYAGKLAIVKQALLSNEAVEIIVQDSDGSEKCISGGVPVTLAKSNNNETILSVKLPSTDEYYKNTDNINESGCIKISMGKIRVIRRVKQ
ncbi:MAG: hypothetical protein LBK66_14060, partial [Spirochaetaceae bacterium]|nr:hypothetical protein [Spirochaetaceae bacterium]